MQCAEEDRQSTKRTLITLSWVWLRNINAIFIMSKMGCHICHVSKILPHTRHRIVWLYGIFEQCFKTGCFYLKLKLDTQWLKAVCSIEHGEFSWLTFGAETRTCTDIHCILDSSSELGSFTETLDQSLSPSAIVWRWISFWGQWATFWGFQSRQWRYSGQDSVFFPQYTGNSFKCFSTQNTKLLVGVLGPDNILANLY